jgi:hypothetical protein
MTWVVEGRGRLDMVGRMFWYCMARQVTARARGLLGKWRPWSKICAEAARRCSPVAAESSAAWLVVLATCCAVAMAGSDCLASRLPYLPKYCTRRSHRQSNFNKMSHCRREFAHPGDQLEFACCGHGDGSCWYVCWGSPEAPQEACGEKMFQTSLIKHVELSQACLCKEPLCEMCRCCRGLSRLCAHLSECERNGLGG